MRTSRILIAATGLAAFAAGYLVRHLSDPASSNDGQTHSGQLSRDDHSSQFRSAEIQPIPTQSPARPRARIFNLTVGQLEAVLNMGMTDPVVMFEEMGLSPSQIQKLDSTWSPRKLENSIHLIELDHASVNEDEDGPYIEIEPFVSERSQWISSFEEEVRKIVDSEQTPIISRALITRRGLLERGLSKRQIRYFRDSSGQLYSRESTFDKNGKVVREDTGKVFPIEANLWKSLIQMPEE